VNQMPARPYLPSMAKILDEKCCWCKVFLLPI
jgi:hypothetical protein